jgi:hypothetical protein
VWGIQKMGWKNDGALRHHFSNPFFDPITQVECHPENR